MASPGSPLTWDDPPSENGRVLVGLMKFYWHFERLHVFHCFSTSTTGFWRHDSWDVSRICLKTEAPGQGGSTDQFLRDSTSKRMGFCSNENGDLV